MSGGAFWGINFALVLITAWNLGDVGSALVPKGCPGVEGGSVGSPCERMQDAIATAGPPAVAPDSATLPPPDDGVRDAGVLIVPRFATEGAAEPRPQPAASMMTPASPATSARTRGARGGARPITRVPRTSPEPSKPTFVKQL
jgi:hypothetical protein